MSWIDDPEELAAQQRRIAGLRPPLWTPSGELLAGGCFVCFGRGGEGRGAAGDRGWAAAVLMAGRRLAGTAEIRGEAGAAYTPGLLAAREGALLEAAVRALPRLPGVLLVNATGRDHPRRAGLALHLGWVLDVPTVGVTSRPLVAVGDPPDADPGAASGLWLDGEQIGWWFRPREGVRPLAVSPGWRTDLTTALEVMRATGGRMRTPEPIRHARRLARSARSLA